MSCIPGGFQGTQRSIGSRSCVSARPGRCATAPERSCRGEVFQLAPMSTQPLDHREPPLCDPCFAPRGRVAQTTVSATRRRRACFQRHRRCVKVLQGRSQWLLLRAMSIGYARVSKDGQDTAGPALGAARVASGSHPPSRGCWRGRGRRLIRVGRPNAADWLYSCRQGRRI